LPLVYMSEWQDYCNLLELKKESMSNVPPFAHALGEHWYSPGCGEGKDMHSFMWGFDPRHVDPSDAIDGFSFIPLTKDWCYCFDVTLKLDPFIFVNFVSRWLNLNRTGVVVVFNKKPREGDLCTAGKVGKMLSYIPCKNDIRMVGDFVACYFYPSDVSIRNMFSMEVCEGVRADVVMKITKISVDVIRGNVCLSTCGGRMLPNLEVTTGLIEINIDPDVALVLDYYISRRYAIVYQGQVLRLRL